MRHSVGPMAALLLVVAAVGCIVAAPLTPDAVALQITSLPGLAAPPSFDQYAGYITVDAAANRQLFFWFTEAQSDADKAPLLLWQTGGPGCSSLYAFFAENGPFFTTTEGYLGNNPWAWNRLANTIFVESPRNVGFSYSTTAADNVVGDAATAADLVVFITEFLRIFPQYAGRDFWLSGESYGGHYVPNLAKLLVQAGTSIQLNLKGFVLGNPWTDPAVDDLAAVEYWASHGLNSLDASAQIVAQCNLTFEGRGSPNDEPSCYNAVQAAKDSWGNVSIYNILVDVGCDLASPPSQVLLSRRPLYANHVAGAAAAARRRKRDYDNCGESELSLYLNSPAVQTAIHATRNNASVMWQMCNDMLNYSHSDFWTPMESVYTFLMAQQPQLQLFVFSGDLDAIVPHVGTQRWIEDLGRPVVEAWRPWYDQVGQTGGRVTTYDRITFATVRGAGHEVPMYTPGRAFVMLEAVLSGRPLPYYVPAAGRAPGPSGSGGHGDHWDRHGSFSKTVTGLILLVSLAVGVLIGAGLAGCVAVVLSRRGRSKSSPHMRLSVFDDDD